MPEYQFFITDGPDGKFQSANQAIRSHAMKTALGRRAQSTADKAHLGSSAISSNQKQHKKNGLKGRYRLQSCSSRLNQANLNNDTQQPAAGGQPRQSSQRECEPRTPAVTGFGPGDGIVDPFNSLPIPLTRWVDRLVKYCVSTPLRSIYNEVGWSPASNTTSSQSSPMSGLTPRPSMPRDHGSVMLSRAP